MFCKNCGQQYPSEQGAVCVKCGAARGQGSNFCPNCGRPVNSASAVCTSCGIILQNLTQQPAKSKTVAWLLAFFLGCWGAHNFYLGYTTKAVIQLVCTIFGIALSCILIGIFIVAGIEIWAFVEFIMILAGSIDKDANGVKLQ